MAPITQQGMAKSLGARNAELEKELAAMKGAYDQFKVLFVKSKASEVTQASIPHPAGERGRDWKLQDAMGLKDNKPLYNDIMHGIHLCADAALLDMKVHISQQDPGKLHQCFSVDNDEDPPVHKKNSGNEDGEEDDDDNDDNDDNKDEDEGEDEDKDKGEDKDNNGSSSSSSGNDDDEDEDADPERTCNHDSTSNLNNGSGKDVGPINSDDDEMTLSNDQGMCRPTHTKVRFTANPTSTIATSTMSAWENGTVTVTKSKSKSVPACTTTGQPAVSNLQPNVPDDSTASKVANLKKGKKGQAKSGSGSVGIGSSGSGSGGISRSGSSSGSGGVSGSGSINGSNGNSNGNGGGNGEITPKKKRGQLKWKTKQAAINAGEAVNDTAQ
ncbi:hypothetical protein FRB95_001598 [Tulasnella sp. JGI-2019a]|nr:hypothetical protein FRB95_001598 [Tulasnella sp. JGI-2019a]